MKTMLLLMTAAMAAAGCQSSGGGVTLNNTVTACGSGDCSGSNNSANNNTTNQGQGVGAGPSVGRGGVPGNLKLMATSPQGVEAYLVLEDWIMNQVLVFLMQVRQLALQRELARVVGLGMKSNRVMCRPLLE
ncbi:MAG: hypothetical protein GMKNLPBB_03384 [Myxococcota bacterium]|nr:hypothetical protein [Myxococcota bacterium]